MRHRSKSSKLRKRWTSPWRDISTKQSRGSLPQGPSSQTPGSYQSNVSTRVGSSKASSGSRYNHSWRGGRRVSKEGNRSWRFPKDSKRAEGNRRSGRSTASLQSQRPSVQSQTSQQQPMIRQDINSCQSLHYGAYVGNETRHVEFKQGGNNYMQKNFCKHVCMYGCAFLNSGGGSLLVGVNDNGLVCGVEFDHKKEDEARLQVDRMTLHFNPPLFPDNYSLRFLPVIKPGGGEHHLKVLCLTFNAPPAFIEPTLYYIDQGEVYMKRDGSVQGPLGASVVMEWLRQMWTRKVQTLAALQPQRKTSPSSEQRRTVKEHLQSSLRQNSNTEGTPDARPAHNTGAPDLAPESSPPSGRSQWL